MGRVSVDPLFAAPFSIEDAETIALDWVGPVCPPVGVIEDSESVVSCVAERESATPLGSAWIDLTPSVSAVAEESADEDEDDDEDEEEEEEEDEDDAFGEREEEEGSREARDF